MPAVTIGPGPLYYEVRGDHGPRVLYLLGLGSYMVQPNPHRLEDYLTAHAHVLLMDTRGVGRSVPQPPEFAYGIEGFAHDAASVLADAGWPRVHVVGVSMGGMVAQAFAYLYADRTATLALLATSAGTHNGVPPADETMAILENRAGLPEEEAVRQGWRTSYTEAFIARERDYLEWRRREQARTPLDRRVYRRHLEALREFDPRPWLKRLTMPALVAWGEEDQIIPPENSRRLAAALPDAHTLALPGLGHGFPTEARPVVADALRRLWERAGEAPL